MSVLLALHGFTGSPQSWDFLEPALGPARIVPALVGHAGSSADSEIARFEQEVDRLAGLAPSGELLHVAGYSLGARLALGLALRHGRRVAHLTLISGHPGLSSETERAARRASDATWCELLLTRGVPAFVDAWQSQPLWASQAALPEELRRRKERERLSHSAAGLAHSLRATGLAEMPDYSAAIADLQIPVSIATGELDTKCTALARLMAGRIPHAELTIVPGAGHDLLLERPDFVTELIRRGNHTP